jgi:AcrR family transcriptional regulator
MPKIAEAARAARREQIIAAGLACFARAGYHATTMADVATQAGVSKGTPYLYFDSKEALFLALHEEWDCGAGERVNAAIAALQDGERQSPRAVLRAVAASSVRRSAGLSPPCASMRAAVA